MRLPAVFRSILLIGITAIVSVVFMLRDARNPEILYGDALGYYLYLPATFIYNNPVSFYEWPEGAVTEESIIWQVNNLKQNGLRTPKGYIINQYTYGVALMEAPFFLAAHAIVSSVDGHANGFSEPYVLALRAGNLVYAILGLMLSYLILRRFFSSHISLLATLGIFLGSNLFWFSLRQAGMSHIPLYFLYALLIWHTIKLYESPKHGHFIIIGLVGGIITLIRPTDIVCLIIPLTYGVTDKASFQQRLLFISRHKISIMMAAVVFILPAIPQLLYWKAASGKLLYYSYGQQTFDWLKPRIIEGLFGGSNGWLAFSPLMVFSIIGLACRQYLRPWGVCLLLLVPVYVYIIYSWYCYNYINGLGSRPMIHLYPLLALPFAAFLKTISGKTVAIKTAVATIALLFIGVNISYSTQQARGMLNSEDSNWAYNLGILFRSRLHYTDLLTKDLGIWQPDPGKLELVRQLAYEGYNDSLDNHYKKDTVNGRSGYVYHMTDEEHHPKALKVEWTKAAFGDAHWLRCSGRFMYTANVGLYENHLLVIDVARQGYYPLWKGLRIENKVGLADSTCGHTSTGFKLGHEEHGQWGNVWCFVKLPDKLKDGDTLELDLWNAARYEIYFDDMKMELWREK
jgi:hypothetical protein